MANCNNTPQPLDLFPSHQLIASREIKSDNTLSKLITLDYSNIGPLVQSVFEKHRNYSKLPICLLTVVAPTDIRELFTYWLIEYLENKCKYPAKITDSESLPRNAAATPGVYLWSKPFEILVGRKENQQQDASTESILLWVVYLNGRSKTLQPFTKVAASIVVGMTNEQTNYPFLPGDNITDVYKNFIGQLGQVNILPVRIPLPNNMTVTLGTFQEYLQWTADTFNKTQPSKRELGFVPRKQTFELNDNNSKSVSEDIGGQPNTEVPRENGQQNNEEKAEKKSEPSTSQIIEEKTSVTKDPCEEQQCALKLYAAEVGITLWIDSTLNKDNIFEMLPMMETYLNFSDPHGIFKELQELVQSLQQYTSELQNMFDNYVCFSGEHDTKQMARFFSNGKDRAAKVLEEKNQVHYDFTSSVLEKCCAKITSIFEDDNNNIVQMEKILAEEGYRRVLEEYQKKMKALLPFTDLEKMEDIYRKISKICTGMLTRSLDYSGKLNHVRSENLDRLNKEMNIYYQNLRESLPKPPTIPVPVGEPVTVSDRDVVSKCVSIYVDEMEKISIQFSASSRQQRKLHHDRTVAKITQNLEPKSVVKEVSILLQSYFLHLNEVCEQALESSSSRGTGVDDNLPSSGSNPTTLSIYISSQMVKVLTTTENGSMMLQFGPRRHQYLPPILAMTHTNKFTFGWEAIQEIKDHPHSIRYKGDVVHYAVNTKEDMQTSEKMLTDLFSNLKHQAQQGFRVAGPYSKVLVVVPSWFDHENRGRIRDACCRARFRQTFIVSEASLAASLVLTGSSSDTSTKEDINEATVVSVGEEHVDVRIYCRDSPVSKNPRSDSLVKLVAISRVEGKHLRNDGDGESMKDVISRVYRKALDQIDGGGKQKVCALICESTECLLPLGEFLKEKKEFTSFRNLREDNDTPNAILRLSKKPEVIGSVLMDYCLPPLSLVKGQQEGNNGESLHNDKLILKMTGLVERCKKIRKQIENGSVKLGVLTRKLVTRTLDNAETIAADGQAGMEELQEQENEIDELIVQYKFKF